MNREIKFEYIYKNNETGKFLTNIFKLEDFEGYDSNPDDFYGEDYKIIARRQFTGLKDINGKEIYEGDIVKAKLKKIAMNERQRYLMSSDVYEREFDGYIEWDDEGADYSIIKNGEVEYGFGVDGLEYEVIGNIFENPNLLEK